MHHIAVDVARRSRSSLGRGCVIDGKSWPMWWT